MNKQLQEMYDILKEKGLKLTPARTIMLEVFFQYSSKLMDAYEIYGKILDKKCTYNFSTIYRNLEAFLEVGIIEKLNLGNSIKYKLINPNSYNHYMICTSCHKTKALPFCPIKDLEDSLLKDSNFMPTKHQVFIYGLCEDCQKNN